MKKFAKMSLVAAVAVAGLTNVNAASLEEAIKGVDVSGQFRYRFQDRNSDTAAVDGIQYAGESANSTDVEVEVGVKVPVNDMVTAVFKIDNANDDGNAASTKGAVTIEDYYFSYVNGAVTVNAGQQNIPGRLTDGAQGDGIVALYNAGAFTVGAAYFNNHTVGAGTGGEDVASVIAMGNVGPVSLLGQYADVDDLAKSYNLKADAAFGPAKVGVEYTETEADADTSLELSTLKAYISGKVSIVSAKLSYVATGDDGSGSLHAASGSYGASVETPSEFLLWQLGSATRSDFDAFAIDASVAVTDKISLRAAYADGEDGDIDVSEALGQVSYKMSKNLNSYFRYSQFESDDEESNRGRVEVKYSF